MDVKDKYQIVKLYENALRKPNFMIKQIKGRDCPIHTRWCSAVDAANADAFMEAYVKKIKKEEPSLSPFEVLENVSIVFPTVKSMDMFQMLNDRNSFKRECLQWTGYSEAYAKMWAGLDVKRLVLSIALRIFLMKFDDMSTLVKLFADINEVRSELPSGDDDNWETGFLKAADIIKQAVYSVWFKRVEESVYSLGDFGSIKRSMYTMVEYKQATGLIPYESVKDVRTDRWLTPLRKIPDPFNVIILRNKRDNSYSCWNYRTNSEVHLLLDKFGVPFDTKLGQLLKAEYTHAELFTKQNGAHLSDGYILSELKEDLGEEEKDEISEDYKLALIAQRDKDDEEQWKRQLGDLDDNVRYEDTNGGHPARIVLRGVARPPGMPYLRKGVHRASRGGYEGRGGSVGGGSAGKRAGLNSDPASELVKMLQKQITSGEKAAQDISKILKANVSDENSYLKGASRKLEDILSSKHDFISKIHKNLDSVSKEIDGITTEEGSSHDNGFGVIPIRKMINGMATSMATVHDMVEKLEASLAAVGINPNATSDTDVFKEMDTRIGALTNTANHKTCMEMRKIMDVVETMMDHMETMINSHTASLTVPAVTHERICVDDMEFNMDDFDGEFAGILKGPGEVAPVSGEGTVPTRASELYAEYHSKMKEVNNMYKTLKSNYLSLIKKFQAFQMDTLKDVSKIAEFKSKTVDARNLVMIYKKFLAAQTKLNREGMNKIEGVLRDLEAKVKEVNHTRQRNKEDSADDLRRIRGDLQAILATVDADEPSDYLEDAVLRSDGVLADIRARKVEELDRVSETFREKKR